VEKDGGFGRSLARCNPTKTVEAPHFSSQPSPPHLRQMHRRMRTRTGLVQWISPTFNLFLSASLPCGSRNTSLFSTLPRCKKQRNRNPTLNAQHSLASGFAYARVIGILLLVDNPASPLSQWAVNTERRRRSGRVMLQGNFSLRRSYIHTSTTSHVPLSNSHPLISRIHYNK